MLCSEIWCSAASLAARRANAQNHHSRHSTSLAASRLLVRSLILIHLSLLSLRLHSFIPLRFILSLRLRSWSLLRSFGVAKAAALAPQQLHSLGFAVDRSAASFATAASRQPPSVKAAVKKTDFNSPPPTRI